MVSRKNDQNLLQSIDCNTICVSYYVNQKLDSFRDERRMGNLKALVSKKKKITNKPKKHETDCQSIYNS